MTIAIETETVPLIDLVQQTVTATRTAMGSMQNGLDQTTTENLLAIRRVLTARSSWLRAVDMTTMVAG